MNKTLTLVCVVPGLAPVVDGVGDYALVLARQLRKKFSIDTHFIVGDPAWTGETQIDGFAVSRVKERSVKGFLPLLSNSNLGTTVVLLHYVGYGYDINGCPGWLVDGLQRWRSALNTRSLITMFHEVYASGPPWTTTFWVSGVQKNLATRLVRISDSCFTNKKLYADLLYRLSCGKHTKILSMPIFSNVGELKQPPPLEKRTRRIVVFGNRDSRIRVYRKSLITLYRICRFLGIKEVLDIGPPTGLNLSVIKGVPIVQMGKLPAAEISNFLSDSCGGFLRYPPAFLAKSTIFAAYCAHGMLPVNFRGNALRVDGLEAGRHYWVLNKTNTAPCDLTGLQAVADNAYAWYKTHDLAVHAETLVGCLDNLGVKTKP